jgi:hypothetical protein
VLDGVLVDVLVVVVVLLRCPRRASLLLKYVSKAMRSCTYENCPVQINEERRREELNDVIIGVVNTHSNNEAAKGFADGDKVGVVLSKE